jgi:ATP-dependent helicase/nuclease subunit B
MNDPDFLTRPGVAQGGRVQVVAIGGPQGVAAAWDRVVAEAMGWGVPRMVAWRDAAVVVAAPSQAAGLRRAWTARGGWVPRIDTARDLAASLGPPGAAGAVAPGSDPISDRLEARRRVRTSADLAAWLAGDERRLGLAARHVADLAEALARAAAGQDPAQRLVWWHDVARRWTGRSGGDGSVEAALSRVAIDWARSAGLAVFDPLLVWPVSAWVIVGTGGADPLPAPIVAALQAPVLHLDLVPCGSHPVVMPSRRMPASAGAVSAAPQPYIEAEPDLERLGATAAAAALATPDLEQEALRASAQVLHERAEGRVPVALVATDRLVVRRAHALLAGHGVAVRDVSGWRLSTSRAGATVIGWLRALQRQATTDEGLDALKHLAVDPTTHRALEARWRRARWQRLEQVEHAVREAEAEADGDTARGASPWPVWTALQLARSQWARQQDDATLRTWLDRLRAALAAGDVVARLEADEAGRAVLQALALDAPDRVSSLGPAARLETLSASGFARWVDETLEEASFYPESNDDPAEVYIVPLSRIAMRPFGAVVVPGADERHLGAPPAPTPLVDDDLAETFGLVGRREAMRREAWAFAWACTAPSVTFLWRQEDAGESLGPSPLVLRLGLAHERAGRGPLPAPLAPLLATTIPSRPIRRGQAVPRLPWPQRLSATQVAALRQCPYRFHVQAFLRLREAEELDVPPDKRMLGDWLHAMLHRFHLEDRAGSSADDRVSRLVVLGRSLADPLPCDLDEFAPYLAALEPFARRYVAWWQAREAEGWSWTAGEIALEVAPWGREGPTLHGRLDRVDRHEADGRVAILDYKASRIDRLRERLRDLQEDTQLLFYTALLQHAEADGPAGGLPRPAAPDGWDAAYLALDDPKGVAAVPHPAIGQEVGAFVEALGNDLTRLRGGSAARALGEGEGCDFCAARGLCRRDHASAAVEPSA